MKKCFLVLFGTAALAANAVTIEWWQEMLDSDNMHAPKVIEAYHGERLDLRCGLKRNGSFFNVSSYTCKFYWQTADMGDNYWSANVTPNGFANATEMGFSGMTTSDKVFVTVFTPSMDPGEDYVRCFFSATSGTEQNYRAHFVIRFHGSPGATPSEVSLPTKLLDFNYITVTNAPYYSKSELNAYLASAEGIGSAIETVIEEKIDGGVLVSNTSMTNWFGSAVDIRKYAATKDYTYGGSYPDEHEWRVGENDGTSVPKTLRFSDMQKIRVSMYGYPMEFFTPNYYAFYGQTASPYVYSNMSKLTPDGSIVPTSNVVARMITAAGGSFGTSSATTEQITAATNALWDAAGEEFVAYTEDGVAAINGTDGDGKLILGIDAAIRTYNEGDGIEFGTYDVDSDDDYKKWSRLTSDGSAVATSNMVTNVVTQLAYAKADGEAWASYWDGDEVRVTVTNYYGTADLPHLYLEQRTNTTGTAVYKRVWDEENRWIRFIGSNYWTWANWPTFEVWSTNVTATLDEKADRAWGYYDSHTGEYAPDGFTQISSSNILVAAGMGYQRTVTSSGDSYWVLTANEPYLQQGTTNGAFQVIDADGNVQVEIVKGDKRTVGARCGGVSATNRTLYARYTVVSASHPTLEVCADLASPTWYAETSASCPATVVWSGSSGAWLATVTPTSASATKIFVRASYQAGGETYVRHNCPVGMSKIVLNGTTYTLGTATISGNTVLTLTEE